ncbi:MAG: hypothetical protein ACTSVI_00095 [Promethearchaeota archaeon]
MYNRKDLHPEIIPLTSTSQEYHDSIGISSWINVIDPQNVGFI